MFAVAEPPLHHVFITSSNISIDWLDFERDPAACGQSLLAELINVFVSGQRTNRFNEDIICFYYA